MRRHTASLLLVLGLLPCGGRPLSAQEPAASASLALPFEARGIRVDPPRGMAVCWGTSPEDATASILALVELPSLRLRESCRVPGEVRLAAISERYVYYRTDQSELLYQLERADLKKQRRLHLGGLESLDVVPGCGPFVTKASSGPSGFGAPREVVALDEEPFQPQVDAPAWLVARRPLAHAFGDGQTQLLNGTVVDATTFAVVCQAASLGWTSLYEPFERDDPRYRDTNRDSPPSRAWGVELGTQSDGRRPARFANDPGTAWGTISERFPVDYRLRDERDSTVVEARELVTRASLWTARVADLLEGRDFARATMVELDAGLLIVLGTKLEYVPWDAERLRAASQPLRIKFPEVGLAPVEQPLRITLEALGGDGQYEFFLAEARDGLAIGSRSGELTLDLPAIWKRWLSAHGDVRSLGQFSVLQEHRWSPLGERPEGRVLLEAPVEVLVADDTGHEGRLRFVVLVSAPKAEVEALYQQTKADYERSAAASAARRAAEREANVPPGDADQRLRRIEAKLDEIIERLQNLERRTPR